MITIKENPDVTSVEVSENVRLLLGLEQNKYSSETPENQQINEAKGKLHKLVHATFCDGRRILNEAKVLIAKNSRKQSPSPDCRPLPPLEICQRYFDVDPEIGLPINRIKRATLAIGDVCGTTNTPYVVVYLKGVAWRWHRIVFKLYHGRDPRGLIDHINGDKRDNRKCNLREVSYLENAQNRHIIKSNSGVLGVSKEAATGHWLASISSCGHNINLGRYRSKECAIAARKHAEEILFADVKGGA